MSPSATLATVTKRTVVYKTSGECAVRLDVFLPATERQRSPVAVWIHGGALIFGDRTGLDYRPGLRDLLLKSGLAIVAIDYRLAPETKLPGILEDLRDAFAWIGREGRGHGLDPDRIGVIGHSAGGYLALMSAFSVVPRPRAVVSFYGYGDITGPWYSRPSPH